MRYKVSRKLIYPSSVKLDLHVTSQVFEEGLSSLDLDLTGAQCEVFEKEVEGAAEPRQGYRSSKCFKVGMI